MMRHFLRFVSLLGLLSLMATLAGCGGGVGTGAGTPTPYPTPVRTTYTVQRGHLTITTTLVGRVLPLAQQSVSFQISGHVGQVYAEVNDTVAAGQLLAELTETAELQKKAEEARRAIRRAEINVEIARLLLERYRAEGRSSYEIKIQQLQVELAEMDLAAVYESFGLDPQGDALAQLEALVAQGRVYAPVSGTVIAAVTSGRSVSPNTPAFIIGDVSQLEVVAELDSSRADEELKEMYEGMPVIVTPNVRPELQLKGKIRQLPSPYGTGNRDDRTVHILLDDPPSPQTYQAGDDVTVQITLADKSDVLWLPPDAIRQLGGRTFVVIPGENGPQRVEVDIGLRTYNMVEILSGLQEGQVVFGP